MPKITIAPCPCGLRGCSDWHLVGIGKFMQGSGFTEDEARRIADLLNAQDEQPVLGHAYFRKMRNGRPTGIDLYATSDWELGRVPFTSHIRGAVLLTKAQYEQLVSRFASHDWAWTWTGEDK